MKRIRPIEVISVIVIAILSIIASYSPGSSIQSSTVESEFFLTSSDSITIKLSSDIPDWAKADNKTLKLNVLSGKYKLVNGTELWTGSEKYIREEWMTFPIGLYIHVGLEGVILKGQSFKEGNILIVKEKEEIKVLE